MLIDLTMQNKGKKTVNDYSTFSPNPSLSAGPSDCQYGMPPNYFAGQTTPPGTTGQIGRIDRSGRCLSGRCGQTGPLDRSDRCHGASLGIHSRTRANSEFGYSWPNGGIGGFCTAVYHQIIRQTSFSTRYATRYLR